MRQHQCFFLIYFSKFVHFAFTYQVGITNCQNKKYSKSFPDPRMVMLMQFFEM